ncbi:unnamed protein product [Adineta steineri]|uniref:F-box domain-containing protein n=1 Tax=Adineta steineri TaxID=433720 RepID=A0A819H027_9BILA|nr:unnamed protein product [Adineta steineri]
MEQIKRQQSNSVDNCDYNKKQKISIETNCLLKEFVTCFENLPNELIYEIFDLLDFHHVYQAFYSLNARFHNLVVNSTVPIEVNLSSISKSTFQRYNKDIILPNKLRIHSLHLSNLCLYDDISSPIHILSQFRHLKTLSLNNIESKHLEDLLPRLLRRLYVSDISGSSTKDMKTFVLAYLTHISLNLNSMDFNEFEEMTMDIFNQAKVLHISISHSYDRMFSNADKWEQLILSHMPNLLIFDIQYHNIIYTNNHNGNQVISNTPIDNFTSSFWIKRQWFFTQQYFRKQDRNHAILYSTDPYSRIIPLKQLTKLVVESNPLPLTKLIELLRCTPHIHTLVLKSMSLYGVNYNSIQQNQSFQLVSNTNTITNVTCNGECTLEKLQILVALFSRIQHLTTKLYANNLESCVRFLLEKTNQNTNHLCSLSILSANKIWYTRLRTLIESETLLDDYMLKMIDWNLYLWW